VEFGINLPRKQILLLLMEMNMRELLQQEMNQVLLNYFVFQVKNVEHILENMLDIRVESVCRENQRFIFD
jgi:hypothetical protein